MVQNILLTSGLAGRPFLPTAAGSARCPLRSDALMSVRSLVRQLRGLLQPLLGRWSSERPLNACAPLSVTLGGRLLILDEAVGSHSPFRWIMSPPRR